MTDEEKAEKHTKENYCNKCYLKDCSRSKNVSCYAMHYNDFLEGLAEGRKEKWHDLREDPIV